MRSHQPTTDAINHQILNQDDSRNPQVLLSLLRVRPIKMPRPTAHSQMPDTSFEIEFQRPPEVNRYPQLKRLQRKENVIRT